MSAYNNEQDDDCLSEISEMTLVGATPLMLPVQQTYLHSYTKKKY